MEKSVSHPYKPETPISVEKPRGNPYEKYRGVPKGGVIKGCDKGHVHLFISGMQKSCIL